MFFLKKLLASLVLPPMGLVLVGLFGLWLSRRFPRLGRSLVLLALLAIGALSMPQVASLLVRSVEIYPPISVTDLGKAQAIVVLGGGSNHAAPEYGVDTVSQATLVRVRYGAYLQKQSGLPLLVSGGAPSGGRPEAESMKEAVERDFGGRVKWTENASRDTAENALLSVRMLKQEGISRIALVSQSWHLARAVPLFERQGIEVLPASTGYYGHLTYRWVLPSPDAAHRSADALHEWLGIFVQRITARD